MKDRDSKPEEGIILFLRHHAAFLLKTILFLIGFAGLMAVEYHLVVRRAHERIASELRKDSVAPASTQVQTASRMESGPVLPQNSAVAFLVKDAFLRMQQHDLDGALDKVNLALQVDPKTSLAYQLRGDIYCEEKDWDEATKNYQAVLQMNDKNVHVHVHFNLAEILFVQKKYDLARPGFAALEHDGDLGDIATYKAFLCDLFGGHEEAASRDLDALDQVGANASYYFANAAWSLYHHKTEDARGWLISAVNIYSPDKVKVYSMSLHDLGYLPLPPLTHL